jgi:hypothetical protein
MNDSQPIRGIFFLLYFYVPSMETSSTMFLNFMDVPYDAYVVLHFSY